MLSKSNKYAIAAYAKIVLAPQLDALQSNCDQLYAMHNQVERAMDKPALSVEFIQLIHKINYAMNRIDAVCERYGINSEEVLS